MASWCRVRIAGLDMPNATRHPRLKWIDLLRLLGRSFSCFREGMRASMFVFDASDMTLKTLRVVA